MTDHIGNLLINLPASLREKLVREVPAFLLARVAQKIAAGELTKARFVEMLSKP